MRRVAPFVAGRDGSGGVFRPRSVFTALRRATLLLVACVVPVAFGGGGMPAARAEATGAMTGNGAVAITTEHIHSAVLRDDGKVWAWGWWGDDIYQPTLVPGPGGVGHLDNITAISAGAYYTLALRNDGTVWGWGWNIFGQLGAPSTDLCLAGGFPCSVYPIAVTGAGGQGLLTDIVAISAGGYHSMALKADGTVWVWGEKNGLGAPANDLCPMSQGEPAALCSQSPVQVRGTDGTGFLGGIVAISAGFSHSLALATDGTVWGWGLGEQTGTDTNTNGILPYPTQVVTNRDTRTTLTNITAISAGNNFSMALRTDGSVWAWGENSFNALGIGLSTSGPFGDCTGGTCQPGCQVKICYVAKPVLGLSGVVQMAAGTHHGLALKNDGTVWGWGWNDFGQVGTGATSYYPIPSPTQVTLPVGAIAIAAGDDASLAILTNGDVWGWGEDMYHILSNDPATQTCSCVVSPVRVVPPGEGASGPIQLPTSLNFGQQTVGIGTTQSVTLTNTGAATVTLGAASLGGPNAAEFALGTDTCSNAPLATGGSCTIAITFISAAIGSRDATLTIGSDAPGSPHTVSLSGVGISGVQLSLGATSLAFGDRALGTTGPAQTTTLRNTGTQPATITGITADGDFAQTNDCPATLAAGASCAISVTFTPTMEWARAGTLRVSSDAPGSPINVGLTGNGVGTPSLHLFPTNLTFADQALASQSEDPSVVSVMNTGTGTASLASIVLGGGDGSDFVITARTCGTTLAPGASCTVTLAFKPSRGAETPLRTARAATLTIQGTNPPATLIAPLSGSAVPPPMMYVHGIKTDVRDVGFEPLLDPLRAEFPITLFPNGLHIFRYYQDKGDLDNNCVPRKNPVVPDTRIAIPYPPVNAIPARVNYLGNYCDSQSDFGINVLLLYQEMRQIYDETDGQRKITMVCHSMGCPIIRGFLAYSMELHAYDPAMPSALELVDSVLFMQGVQAGSNFAKTFAHDPSFLNHGIPGTTTQLTGELYREAVKGGLEFDLDRPAVYGLRPQSAFYAWMRQQSVTINGTAVVHTPPLDYFNVYGDVRVVEKGCLFINTCWDIDTTEVGDLAILPGETSSPYGLPENGGSRFLNGSLGPQNWEWGLRHDIPFYAVSPLPVVGGINGIATSVLVLAAPENHLVLGAGNSGLPQVLVEDCANPGQQVRLDIQLVQIVRGRLYGAHYNCRQP